VHTLIDQTGFPDPGFPDHRHHLAVTCSGTLQGLAKSREFRLPADKTRQSSRHPGLESPPERTRADQLKDLYWFRQPLHRDGSQGRDLHQPLHQPEGVGRQEDAPSGGELFHAGREMRCLAHGRVIHVQIIADRPHHDCAGVETDAHLHGDAMGAARFVGIGPDRGLHGEGRIAGPEGMVLMRNRGAEQRHNAIPHDLVDRPLVAVHGRHHAFQDGIEELPGLLRITVSQEFHRALEVRKQHRDLLAFPFHGTAGRENLLGQIRGRVGERFLGVSGGWGRHGGGRRWGWHGHCGCSNFTRPHQHGAVLVDGALLDRNELVLEVLQKRVVNGKLTLQGAIGDPAVLL
jgi:hypothetical protein